MIKLLSVCMVCISGCIVSPDLETNQEEEYQTEEDKSEAVQEERTVTGVCEQVNVVEIVAEDGTVTELDLPVLCDEDYLDRGDPERNPVKVEIEFAESY